MASNQRSELGCCGRGAGVQELGLGQHFPAGAVPQHQVGSFWRCTAHTQTNHIRIPGCGVQVPVGFKLPQWLQCAAELARVFEVGLGMSLPCRARVMKVSEEVEGDWKNSTHQLS